MGIWRFIDQEDDQKWEMSNGKRLVMFCVYEGANERVVRVDDGNIWSLFGRSRRGEGFRGLCSGLLERCVSA